MQVITFPKVHASEKASNGQEGLVLSLFRMLDAYDQEIVMSVLRAAVKHSRKPRQKPVMTLIQ